MKTPTRIAGAALALAVIASAHDARAQLAASGTPGDHAVYTLGTGGTLGTGLGTAVVHPFETGPVADTDDSFNVTATPGVIEMTAGHHVVIYGIRFQNTAPARVGIDSTIKVNGTAQNYGNASSYMRDGTANNGFVRGGTVLDLAQGDTVEIESARSDNHSQTANRTDADLQLIKLDDGLDVLRLGGADDGSHMPLNNEGPSVVTYGTQDEVDAGSFAHTAGTGDVTLVNPGHYLVFANTGYRATGGTQRQAVTQQLTIDGAVVEDGSTMVYMRHAGSGDGAGGLVDTGAGSIGMIVETTTPNAILRVQSIRDNDNSSATISVEAARTSLAVVALPSYGEYVTLSGPQQDVNFAQANPETTLDLSDSSAVNNGSFNYPGTGNDITVNKSGGYLFLASHYCADMDPNNDRQQVRQGFVADLGGAGAMNVSWGHGGSYHRGQAAGADRARDSGDWAGAVLSLGFGDTVATSVGRYGSNPQTITLEANSVGLQALNIASISAEPLDPVIAINNGLAMILNTSATITSADLLTIDATLGDVLTYTVLDAPTGGTLRRAGVALTGGSQFTQADIDADLITFDAGAVAGTDFGFEFEVLDVDPGATEAADTFVIAIGIPSSLVADTAAGDEDTNITEVNGGDTSVLDNDTGTALAVTSHDASSALGAAVTMAADGTFVYDPSGSATIQALDDGDTDTDSFSYTTTDFAGESASQTVTVSLTGLNDAPVVTGEAFSTGNRGLITGNLLTNDTDADATDILFVSSLEGANPGELISPEGAAITIGIDGSFTYNPCTSADLASLAAGTSLTETLTYEVGDGTTTTSGTIMVTIIGELGTDIEFVNANGAGSTVNIEILTNDNTYGDAGTATAGAAIELDAGSAGNSDTTWNNTGSGGNALTMNGAGTESVLALAPANAPVGVTAAYDLSGNGSGALLPDVDTAGGNPYLYGSNFSTSSYTIEATFRPDDQVGNSPIWGSGGNGTGSSLVLLDNLVVFTIGNNANVAQAVGALPASAVAGGEYVHVVGTFDIDTDTATLYINNVPVSTGTAINITTGAASNITDWSGTDDEGIGRTAGTTGGDINIAPFLGNFGTIDLPNDFSGQTERFDGELAVVRVYPSALAAGDVQTNFESVFGEIEFPIDDVSSLAAVAGTTNPEADDIIVLPSGALVTVEADGSLTYDPNGAFDDLANGVTVIDSFTYTLVGPGGISVTGTAKVVITGTNTSTAITIAADQTSVAEGGTAGFTLTASAPVASNTDVTVAYSGTSSAGDFFLPPTTATILAGQSTADLDIIVISDSLFEGTEDLVLTIDSVGAGSVIGGTSSASTLLEDTDTAPVYSIAAVSATSPEGSLAMFTISSPSAASSPVDVVLTAGGDATISDGFIPRTRTVTVPPAATSATFDTTIFDDGAPEGPESLSYTMQSVSVGSIGTDTASTDLIDGTADGLFFADFEGVTINPSTGANAEAAANEGTDIGTWVGVPSTTTTGNVPGVVLESGPDVKGDGDDSSLRVDRPPTTEDGIVDAVLADAMDLTANTGLVAFDISSRRTAGNDQKSFPILGLDSRGNVAFKLIVSANNVAGPTDERLLYEDAEGNIIPLGNVNDLANSGGWDEDDQIRVTLDLQPGGYTVSIDAEPIDGAPDSVSGLLPYAGTATQIERVRFAIAGSGDDNFNAGVLVDDVIASGTGGNIPPTLALDGIVLAEGGSTPLSTVLAGETLSFNAFTATQLSVGDADAEGGTETVRLQSVAGLGTISLTLGGGASISAGANNSADVTISGTLAALNTTLFNVTYTAGGLSGDETLRLTANDGGNTGVPGPATSTHDFTFLVTSNPTVTVNQALGQPDPTPAASINFTAVFSEPVDNFDGSDVDFSGSTTPGALSAVVSGGPTTWNIAVSGASDCETVVASLLQGAATRAGTADPTEASTSDDNSVLFIANLPPSATNLSQDLGIFAVPTPLDDIVVSDGNGSSIANTAGAVPSYVWFNGDPNPAPGDPGDQTVHEQGFAFELAFTPTANDIAVGAGVAAVNIYETGGTSNGHGVYMIDGIPYFLCKMNSVATTLPSGLNDTDWDSGNSDDMVSVPLSAAPLAADAPVTLAVIYRLDDITYSLNGSAPVTIPLTNRNGRWNWSGDDSIHTETLTGPGALSSVAGTPYDQNADVRLENGATSATFWLGSGPDFIVKALGEEEITASITILQTGEGSLSTDGGGSFAGDVWSITGTLSAVNAALAAVEFVPNGATGDFIELQVLIDDGDEDGSFPIEGEINLSRSLTTPIEDWRLANGYTQDGSGPGEGNLDIVAPNGLTNLENFALGFDAQATGDTGSLVVDAAGGTITSLGVPNVVLDPNDGKLYFQFTRRADYLAAGLTLTDQVSADCEIWVEPNGGEPAVVATGTGDDGVAIEALRIELPALLPPPDAPAYFARLLITVAP